MAIDHVVFVLGGPVPEEKGLKELGFRGRGSEVSIQTRASGYLSHFLFI